jgi:LacI family transcriptional regulator
MKKVTSRDVADLANVSQAAVSFILNNAPNVSFSEETRSRVVAAARELGYSLPRRAAARKRFSQARQLHVFVPTLMNYYFTEVLQWLQEYAYQRDCGVAVCNTFRSVEIERRYLDLAAQADGIIYTFLPSFPDIVEKLSKAAPVVLIGEKPEELGLCSIELNNHIAGGIVADHLYGLGHRQFAFISTPLERFSRSRGQRLQGIRKALEGYGLPRDAVTVAASEGTTEQESPVSYQSYEYEIGRRFALEVLDSGCGATAYVCVNDMTALGAITALRERGVAVPGKISVCGFDNIFPSAITTPALTTVDHQLRQRCGAAVDMTLQNDWGSSAAVNKIEYLPQLVVRESTGPAPR